MNSRKTSVKQVVKREAAKHSPEIKQGFAEVVLGRPSSNCKNFGICRIEGVYPKKLSYDVSDCCGDKALTYAVVSYDEDLYFELAFLRSTINKVILDQHFNSVFIVEEPYTVKIDFMKQPWTIQAGRYSIKLSDAFLTVRF